MINKEKLVEVLVQHQKLKINELKDRLNMAAEAADIDESDTLDPEDYSRQNEANDIKLIFENQLRTAEQDLKHLLLIDTSSKNAVVPGALVFTDNFNFFVGISFPTILFEKINIIGISTETPIYIEIQGKKNGDKFTISEKTYSILSIQ
jgi:hypothetical protein